MDLHPPALINKQVTEDMLRWMMVQPNTVTMNTTTNEFNITPAKGAQDYHIDERTKDFILYELANILEFNGYRSELLANGNLRVSKDHWQMDIERIHDLLPFPDYLPYQIEQAYKHQNNLHSSQEIRVWRHNEGWEL
ncbi:hypothetical protein [Shewanella phage vB_SbaS_Y11]|nr:hypothetical protein [Shewanella phage vB_SbaS_Y11]